MSCEGLFAAFGVVLLFKKQCDAPPPWCPSPLAGSQLWHHQAGPGPHCPLLQFDVAALHYR